MYHSRKYLIVGVFSLLFYGTSLAQSVSEDHTLQACDNLKNTFLGKDGWIFEDWELQNTFTFTANTYYKDLQDALEKRGVYLISVPIPSRPYAYINTVDTKKYPALAFSKDIYRKNWNLMIKSAQASGINVVNILPIVDNFKVTSRNENFFYTGDHHWTTSGAQASAMATAEYIDKLLNLKNVKFQKTNKNISEVPGNSYNGSFNYHYTSACGTHVDDLKTYKVIVSSAAENLLDDDSPFIGVFGDSFGLTNPDNNFAPYLEYYSRAKVVNYSVGGGGFFGSMLGYFSDPNTNKNLPKVIVVPAQGVLQNDSFEYKQVLAALNLCREGVKNSSMQNSLTAVGSWSTIAYNKAILSQSKVINFNFDKQVSKFKLKLVMSDKKESEIEIDRYFPDDFHGSRTNYYIPIENTQNLMSISIMLEDKDTLSKNVYTNLCKS